MDGVGDMIGQEWQNLLSVIVSRPGDVEGKSSDLSGDLQDVKRLRCKDMSLFGRCPETDLFYTVVCSVCSMILMPHALREHIKKRHADDARPQDRLPMESPGKMKKMAKKGEKEKSRRVKALSASPPDLTDELKRNDKKKNKSPDRTVPPELEPMLPSVRSDKRKHKLVTVEPELLPAALSPIKVEKAEDGKKKKDKRKGEKKADKVYDPNKHCGVINDIGKPCLRSILCKVHQVALKRAVPNRAMPYDVLTKMLKTHGGEEKVKVEKVAPPETKEPPVFCIVSVPPTNGTPAKTWTPVEQPAVQPPPLLPAEPEEPPSKRLKMKEEEEMQEEQYVLPSDLDALIEETLKDVEENEPLPVIPVVPKPEPVLRWSYEPQTPRPSSPPPHFTLDDIHWHSSHPKPLATNTFGCRLVGGLMSTCKKLDALRKHLQSVWSPGTARFGDLYGGQAAAVAAKNHANLKYMKKPSQNKPGSLFSKKSVLSAGDASMKRKRKVHPGVTASNASDIISGLLIGNPALPGGVQGVGGVGGVPGVANVRLFQGSLPVIASAASNQPTFIQLNLCPPK